MTARFRKRLVYPSTYPNSLVNEQSPVPSQENPVPAPYDPSRMPQNMPTAPVQAPSKTIVRAVYDSRPLNCYDMYFEDAFLQGISQQGGYDVPQGYVLVLRDIIISVYPFGPADLLTSAMLTPFGDPDPLADGFPRQLSILIDGGPAPTWTVGSVQLFDVFASDVEIETFILVEGGQNISIQLGLGLSAITSADGVTPTLFNTYVKYHGNMLLSTGRDAVAEIGNADPLLVEEEYK